MIAARVEELRKQGLALYMAGKPAESLPYFEEAMGLADDEETRDLLIVNKAGAHLALQENSSEIQQLPQVMMRRPKLRGLAAYNLAAKFENEKDFQRARVYLDIATRSAEADHDDRLRLVTLIALGNVIGCDSRFKEAIEKFEAALQMNADTPERRLWHAFALQGIGYSKLMIGNATEGVDFVNRAVAMLKENGGEGYLAECYIDLCLGYLDLEDIASAQHYGELGMSLAWDQRQVRNAHYLLGEIAYKSGDVAKAKEHFSHLAAFYPEFPQLTNVLFALDLRKMVNFRL